MLLPTMGRWRTVTVPVPRTSATNATVMLATQSPGDLHPFFCSKSAPDKGITVDRPTLMGGYAQTVVRQRYSAGYEVQTIVNIDLKSLKILASACAPFT